MGQEHPLFMRNEALARIEQIENSPEKKATLRKIKAEMVLSTERHNKLILLAIPLFILLSIVVQNSAILVLAVVAFVFYWRKQSDLVKRKNTASYVDNFLLPVLKEVLPNVEVDYWGSIDKRVFDDVTPKTENHVTSCHIKFNDEYLTEFCNLWAYHTYEDSEGVTKKVDDFHGQVLQARYETGLRGHIRVVPTKIGMFGREKQHGYEKVRKDERQIETEDIQFNQTFNVYCTDELTSRALLNPYLLRMLAEYRENYPVALTMDEKSVALSFYTGTFILRRPENKQEIEELTLSGEYKKVQNQLGKFYALLDTVNSQL